MNKIKFDIQKMVRPDGQYVIQVTFNPEDFVLSLSPESMKFLSDRIEKKIMEEVENFNKTL